MPIKLNQTRYINLRGMKWGCNNLWGCLFLWFVHSVMIWCVCVHMNKIFNIYFFMISFVTLKSVRIRSWSCMEGGHDWVRIFHLYISLNNSHSINEFKWISHIVKRMKEYFLWVYSQQSLAWMHLIRIDVRCPKCWFFLLDWIDTRSTNFFLKETRFYFSDFSLLFIILPKVFIKCVIKGLKLNSHRQFVSHFRIFIL